MVQTRGSSVGTDEDTVGHGEYLSTLHCDNTPVFHPSDSVSDIGSDPQWVSISVVSPVVYLTVDLCSYKKIMGCVTVCSVVSMAHTNDLTSAI